VGTSREFLVRDDRVGLSEVVLVVGPDHRPRNQFVLAAGDEQQRRPVGLGEVHLESIERRRQDRRHALDRYRVDRDTGRAEPAVEHQLDDGTTEGMPHDDRRFRQLPDDRFAVRGRWRRRGASPSATGLPAAPGPHRSCAVSI